MSVFVGRKNEISRLEQHKGSANSVLVVVRGRRRIGKSRLIEEFAKDLPFFKISGLPPTKGSGTQLQKSHFAESMQRFGFAKPNDSDWYNLFLHLAQNLPQGPKVVLLDEISWMAKGDSSFLSKLKDIWDDHFKKHNGLILVLCGSVSSWIDKNILSGTAFLGRITEKITLGELSVSESLELLYKQGFKGSAFDKLMTLSVTGGVPWYLEQFGHGKIADAHIQRLAFKKDGLLVDEFKRIFNDLFGQRSLVYESLVSQLALGPRQYNELSKLSNYPSSGALSEYLSDLEAAGFISKDISWSLNTGLKKQIAMYRLSDNYLRFYFRCILPNLNRINAGHFEQTSIRSIKGFSSILGLQFENLVLNNRELLFHALAINRQDIMADNPYLQREGKTQSGCQVDYMIQTEFNNLFVCEIKLTQKVVRSSVIKEVQEKIAKLKKPKNLSCLPVLIYFGEVSASILESRYFYKVIDFRRFIE